MVDIVRNSPLKTIEVVNEEKKFGKENFKEIFVILAPARRHRLGSCYFLSQKA